MLNMGLVIPRRPCELTHPKESCKGNTECSVDIGIVVRTIESGKYCLENFLGDSQSLTCGFFFPYLRAAPRRIRFMRSSPKMVVEYPQSTWWLRRCPIYDADVSTDVSSAVSAINSESVLN